MEKTTWETILAVVLGIVLGVAVAFSVWLVKSGKIALYLPTKTTVKIAITATPSPTPLPLTLLISSPSDNSLVNSPKVKVSGKTNAFYQVIISLPGSDSVIKADKDGLFEKEIELDEGDNQIYVTSLDTSGQSKQEVITVWYEKK